MTNNVAVFVFEEAGDRVSISARMHSGLDTVQAAEFTGEKGDTIIGAFKALSGLFNVDPAYYAQLVLDDLKAPTKGEEDKEEDARVTQAQNTATRVKVKADKAGEDKSYKGVSVGKLVEYKGSGSAVLARESGLGDPMGVCGAPTTYADCEGRPLFVGDLVIVSEYTGTMREGKKWEELSPKVFVAADADGPFVMGLHSACDPVKGKIDKHYKVRRVKTWREVEVGESHGFLQVMYGGATR